MSCTSCTKALWRLAGVAALLGTALMGCQRRPPPIAEPVATDACAVGELDRNVDTIRVAMQQGIDEPEVVAPRSSSERLVFRQLYQSLVAVDCDGRVRPAVAESWTSSQAYREWTFRVGGYARFSDGVRVNALHVLDAWERIWPSVSRDMPAGEYFNYDQAVTEGVVVIQLQSPDEDLPARLARPELAIARYRPTGDQGWPIGTTPYSPTGPNSPNSRLILEANPERPSLIFVSLGASDVRDALDADLDAVIGRSRDFVDYARRRGAYSTIGMPWDQTYGIVYDAAFPAMADLRQLREDVARDAVSVDARAVTCNELPAEFYHQDNTTGGAGAILFERRDGSAREIAERIVAMNNSVRGRQMQWSAEGVSRSALVSRVGRDASAAIVSIATGGTEVCQTPLSPEDLSQRLSFVPLIQVRAHLAIRKGGVTAVVHGDGVPQFFVRFPQ